MVDLSSLTGILGDLTKAIPDKNELINNVILGAGTSVVLAGLKSKEGGDALDPLHIFHKDGGVSVTNGPTITMAAFIALSAETQKTLVTAGYHIQG